MMENSIQGGTLWDVPYFLFLAAEDSGREREKGLDEPEKSIHGYPDQPEGKHQEPDDREKEQGKDCQRPAHQKQQQP